jgi:anti-sigma B factor antagonist
MFAARQNPGLSTHRIVRCRSSNLAKEVAVSLQLRIARVDGLDVLVPVGEVDISTAPVLSRALDEALDRSGARVLVDLSGVEYMEAVGFNALIRARKRAVSVGGTVALVSPNSRMARLIGVLALDKVFPIYPTTSAAVEQVRGRG